MRPLALEHVTVLGLSPPDIVSVASEAGYDAVAICLPPSPVLADVITPLVGAPALVRETARRMKETGLRLSLGEGFVIAPETLLETFHEPLDIASALGAACINCTIMDEDRAHALDLLAGLTDLAARSGLETAIEFSAFSPLASSLTTSLAIVREIGNPHLGLLVDVMHIVRCGDQISALAQLLPGIIKYAQICDGPLFSPSREAYMEEALYDRKIPGDGEFDLRAYLDHLPRDIVLGVETPSRSLRAKGLAHGEVARFACERTRSLLAGAAK